MAQRVYTCKNQSNVNTRPFTLMSNRFSASGDTTSRVASVNSLTVTHYHSATGGKNHKWTCEVVITFGDGSTITSDQVTHSTGESKDLVPAWVNTFSNVDASKIQNYGMTQLEIRATANSGDYVLYWRATNDHPVTVSLDFGTYVPTQPTITSASFTNASDIYGSVTSPVFNHVETYDSNATNITRTLRLYKSGFDVKCTIPSTSPVTLNPIETTGSLNWIYTVSDSFGQTVSTNGTLYVNTYRAPTIEAFTAMRQNGDNTKVDVNVYAIGRSGDIKNIKVLRWEEGSSTKYYVINVTNYNSTLYTNTVSVSGLSPSKRYYFELTIDDGIQNAVQKQVVNGLSALLSVEKNGVAVGKIATRGSASTPNFEVDMPSYFTQLATFSDVQYSPRSTATITITKSGFSHWTSWAQVGQLKVTRIGPYVFLYGGIVSTSDITYTEGTYYIGEIATLTSAYRPLTMIGITQMVNSTDICIKAEIQTDGKIILRSNKPNGPFPSGNGILLTASWIAASSFSS